MIDYDDNIISNPEAFYSFKEKTIEGEEIDFNQFRGKTCLVFNTACNCGLAKDNYKLMKEVKEKYPKTEILLFPGGLYSGWFLNQENKETSKIIQILKNEGIYQISTVFEPRPANSDKKVLGWLKKVSRGIMGTKALKWNFTKFVISKNAERISRFSPTASYDSLEPTLRSFYQETGQQE
ncbi:hypothetical protein NEOKW01_1277 [Nematocida sp. AWRm80]|nr:hypothetical protein NEOKW01_1277 [Nematocida sp. AWRm80]